MEIVWLAIAFVAFIAFMAWKQSRTTNDPPATAAEDAQRPVTPATAQRSARLTDTQANCLYFSSTDTPLFVGKPLYRHGQSLGKPFVPNQRTVASLIERGYLYGTPDIGYILTDDGARYRKAHVVK